MDVFYIVAGGLAVLVAGTLVRPLLAGRGEADTRHAPEAQVFRDQLSEIDRDLARGTIKSDEAEGARIEVSRRLIAAVERARRAGDVRPAPEGHSGLIAGLAVVGIPVLAAALYVWLGAPGVPDQPLGSRPANIAALGTSGAPPPRPAQEDAEALLADQIPASEPVDSRYAEMIGKLEETVADRPSDVEGHRLLANGLMNLGRYAAAWRTYDRLINLMEGTAGAEIHAAKAEAMILATGGYVSPEAEAEIATALKFDPSLPVARYYGGLALRQAGRVNEAIDIWQALRTASPPDAPYLKWLDVMLAEAIRAQGGMPPGPTQGDIARAEQLSPEERAAMIESMVARLENRLTSHGGPAEDWLRLINAYVQLDRPEEAARAYRVAAAALAGDPAAGFVKEQALLMGVAVESR